MLRTGKWVGCGAMALALGFLLPAASWAGTIHYNFTDGLGTGLSVVNEGGLFSVEASGGALRVHKPADGGVPPGSLRGGVVTDYLIDGDFVITAAFDLAPAFPFPGEDQFNAATLEVLDGGSADQFIGISVPAPGTLLLTMLGVVGVIGWRRRGRVYPSDVLCFAKFTCRSRTYLP